MSSLRNAYDGTPTAGPSPLRRILFSGAAMLCALFIAAMTPRAHAAVQYGCIGDSLQPLPVALTANGIAVSGATPGGKVLVVGHAQGYNAERYSLALRRFQAFATADPSGDVAIARRDLAGSVWAAVDVASGRCGTVADGAAPDRQERIPRNALKVKNGKLKNVEIRIPVAYMVLVRPDEGAWEISAGDGGSRDDDDDGTRTPNGKISLSLDAMTPIGRSGPVPEELRTGDLLVVFAPAPGSIAFARLENAQ